MREMGVVSIPEPREACRRDGLHPFAAHRIEQSQSGAVHDEHRRAPYGPTVGRLVGDLRPRFGERKPARLRRDVRPERTGVAQRTLPQLDQRLFAGGVPRDVAQTHRRRHRQPQTPWRRLRQRSRSVLGVDVEIEPDEDRTDRGRPRSRSPHQELRTRLPDADRGAGSDGHHEGNQRDAGTVRRRPEGVRPVRQAVPHGPADGRTRRPFCTDLQWRNGQPALVGWPRRSQRESRRLRRRDGPTGRGAAHRSESEGVARFDARDLGR